ncbi:MAG: hypothetical protein RIS29_2520 [Bacteroidota bacterium]|jgi:hypothetical protein
MNEEMEILSSHPTGKELKDFLDEVPSGKLKSLEKALIIETGINSTIFKNWKRGITPVPIPARKLMNVLANKEFSKSIFKIECHEHSKPET